MMVELETASHGMSTVRRQRMMNLSMFSFCFLFRPGLQSMDGEAYSYSRS